MAVKVVSAGPTAAVVNEALNVTDPRVGVEMNIDIDQSALLSAGVTLAATALNGSVTIPPGYINVDSLALTVPNDRTVPIRGAGGASASLRAATVLKVPSERPGGSIANGSGRVINAGGGTYPYHLEGFCLYGPRLNGGVKGTLPAQFDGIRLNGQGICRDVSAIGFRAGCIPLNDHHLIDDCNFQGNGFALDWGSGATGIGGTVVRHCYLNGCTLASIGVAKDNPGLAGVRIIEHSHIGTSPFGFYRYSNAGVSVPGWIAGLSLIDPETEYMGNGFMYDEVGDGNVDSVKIVGLGGGIWGMFSSDMLWAAKPQLAAMHTGGGFSQIVIEDGYLWSDATSALPAMLAGSLSDIRFKFPRSSGVHLTTTSPGAKWFALLVDSVNPSSVRGIQVGTPGLTQEVYTAGKVHSGSIEQYDTVTNHQEYGLKLHSGAATERVIGVAMHAAALNAVCHMATSGRVSHIKARNKTASSIANGALLKPDPVNAGGVVAAASMSDGQVFARAMATMNAGAATNVELFIY